MGIDVGGTFTHAVAVDADSLKLVGKVMVPTTHTAKAGVAQGVVDSMRLLMQECKIKGSDVALIAHSTTQATNALLEGDVAPVGVIGMGKGAEGWRAKSQTALGDIELSPGKFLRTYHRFIDTSNTVAKKQVEQAAEAMLKEGAKVFVVSEAFGVDNPDNERAAVEHLRSLGHTATSASAISQLYGLRVRTRTAALNASMLPKMLETAEMTERSVRKAGIRAPLMIMRSDGGIMDVGEMRRRPILTMLSGPAAGVAAALMYLKISDGIFLEVGGTSTDISVIKNGRPMIRTAEVGGNRLFVRTLDVRTVGIAGGSMARGTGRTIHDVGPRSTHIAGLRYISFAEPDEFSNPELVRMCPKDGDPDDYLAVKVGNGKRIPFAITPTEAANVLGLAKQYALSNKETLQKAFTWLAEQFRSTPEKIAEEILECSSKKAEDVIRQFIGEYTLDLSLLALVGGGGGAEAIVPFAAQKLGMECWIAENAEVISAIGAALGMMRDTIERSVVNPTDADIVKIRNEAVESVLSMGAAPESIDVRVEVDTKNKRLIATATGAPEMRSRELTRRTAKPEEQLEAVRKSFGHSAEGIAIAGKTKFHTVYYAVERVRKFFGLIATERRPHRVVDREGIIRLKVSDGVSHAGTVSSLHSALGKLIDDYTMYGDAGGLSPDVFFLTSGRIIDLSGLANKEQMLSVLRLETETFSRDESAVVLISKK